MSTSERILHCAIEELSERGLEGLSLRSVGVKAGVTPMAVYRHYASKAELLKALGEHAFDLWLRRVRNVEAKDTLAWLDGVSRAFIDFALEEPRFFEAAFVLRTNVERIYPDDFRSGKSPVVLAVSERLTQGQAEGVIRDGDALEMAMALWAMLQGFVALHASGRFNMARPEFIALCLRSVAHIYTKGE